MEALLVVISIIILIFCMKNKVYHKSILTIFCVMWTSIFVLYSLRFYDLYDCKEQTFLMYLIGISSFFVGYLFIKPSQKSYIPPIKHEIKNKITQIRIRLLIVLSIISIIVLAKKAFLALPLLMAGGTGAIKTAIIQDDALNVGGIEEVIYTFLARPMQIIMVIYAIVVILSNLKEKIMIWLAVLLTLLGFICSGSKSAIAEILTITFAYIFLFSNMSFKDVYKKYRKLFISCIIVVSIIILLIGMKDDGFLLEFYTYVCGCMPCSDEALTDISGRHYYYGLASLNGILRAINLIPSNLGIVGNDFKLALDVVWYEMMNFERTIYISAEIKYNAFVSMFTYFYADGGYLGVAIISFMFGFFSSIILKKALKTPNIYRCSLVLFIVVLITLSMIRFQLFYVPYAMSLIYIIFLFPRTPISIYVKQSANNSK